MKKYNLSGIRAISILLVVFAHSIIIYNKFWTMNTYNVYNLFLEKVCLCIYIFSMPLFFSLSGFFINKTIDKKINYLTFIKKKIVRLLVPFFLVAFLWLLPVKFFAGYEPYTSHELFYNIFNNIILMRDVGHLWFLPCLFIIFMIYYPIKTLIKNNKIRYIIVVVLSIIGLFVPTIIGRALKNMLWFSLGDYMYSTEVNIKKSIRIILFLFIACLITLYIILYGNYANYNLYCTIISYIICLLLIPLIYIVMPKIENKYVEKISKDSFGLYLFQSPLLYIVFGMPSIINKPLLTIFINFIVFGLISMLITELIRKTKLKVMIGE